MAKDAHFPQVGEVFEQRYAVESVLGRGGFSRVYLARQIDLDRLVALKVLNPDSEKIPDGTRLDVIVKRFDREAKMISKFKDSHTVVMHDYGRTDEDLLYMVLEHVDGKNLRQLVVDDGALSSKRVVHILRQILSSLQEAHALGVLHRDMKPQNVMIYEHVGRKDQIKVLDFGIAKTFAGDKNRDTKKLTMQGTIVGTPRYMSPEQLRGDIKLGPPSDIYSLGLVAYELLVGQKVAADLSGLHVVERHLNSQPILLPEDLEIPGGLRAIVNSMMAKPLADRYADCSEVLDVLDDWKQDSVATPRGSVGEKKGLDSRDEIEEAETKEADSLQVRTDAYAETAESPAPKIPGGSVKTVRIAAPSSNKATLQMPVENLTRLTEESAAGVVDTIRDRRRPDFEHHDDDTNATVSADESLAETIADRAAVVPEKNEHEPPESRGFSKPVSAVQSTSGESSSSYGKWLLFLLGGATLAYAGWFATQHFQAAESDAAAAEIGAADSVAPVVNSEETVELQPMEPEKPEPVVQTGLIEAKTAAIASATAIATAGWKISSSMQAMHREEAQSPKKASPPKKIRRTESAAKKPSAEKRKPADTGSNDAPAEEQDQSNSNKLKPLDRIAE